MFVSAVDQKGEPVEGLGPGDFVIREDGAAREVLRVSRATEPIDIAILVDDSAASDALIPRVREALKAFTATMSKGNQIAIVGLADRPRILANYTANTKLLQDAIGLLWPQTRAGSTLRPGRSGNREKELVILVGGDKAAFDKAQPVLGAMGRMVRRIGDSGAFEPPADTDPADFIRDDPLAYGDAQPIEARVLVDAPRAAWVVDQLGEEVVVERRDDGAVVVALSVVNREAFRTWVLELLEHAEVLAPAELRDELVGWLRALEVTT